MLTAELSELEEVGALIEHGRRVGVLMYAEVAQAVFVLDLDEADIEKLHGLLEKRGIELVEEFEPAAAADVQEPSTRAPGRPKRRSTSRRTRPPTPSSSSSRASAGSRC